jgi:hypothetical protein
VNQKKAINLKEYLDEENRNYADFDIELVASDSYAVNSDNGINTIFLATWYRVIIFIYEIHFLNSWIVYDHLFAPERQFAALFYISLGDFQIKLG